MIEDFQHMVLQWSRYRSAKRDVMDLEEQQLSVTLELEAFERLLQLYADLHGSTEKEP